MTESPLVEEVEVLKVKSDVPGSQETLTEQSPVGSPAWDPDPDAANQYSMALNAALSGLRPPQPPCNFETQIWYEVKLFLNIFSL